jgi:hypothetical protein
VSLLVLRTCAVMLALSFRHVRRSVEAASAWPTPKIAIAAHWGDVR